MMAATNQLPSKTPGSIVYTIRLPRNPIPKKFSILKFNESNNVDFTACGQIKLERENNFKEFKSAYDIDNLPKFGAGSEFGREQREEARKKKFGVRIRKYNPQEQPWQLKIGSAKQVRRFKGNRKGGLLDSASYYIFTQCPDGVSFEASPVEEWYDFLPQARYKSLTAEEAEEEFNKRGKTLNHFAIMVSKRIKNNDGEDFDVEEGESSGKKKTKKKDKSLVLTEQDDWADSDDDDNNDDDDGPAEDKDDDEKKPRKKQKDKKKEESDEEAVEEEDDFDEGQEVDYISGESSDDEMMYEETRGEDDDDKYKEKGVDDEDGLKKLLDSEDEDESEEKKDEENDEDEEGRLKEEQSKASDSESSSDSDVDSEPEKDYNFAVGLLPPQDKKPVKKLDETEKVNNASRPTTPAPDGATNGKRKKPETQSPANSSKKSKLEGASASTSMASTANSSTSIGGSQSDGGIEGLVKRYLARKPMTTKDLLQKVTSKHPTMSKEQLVKIVGQILQRLKLDKVKTNNKLYFSLKKDSST